MPWYTLHATDPLWGESMSPVYSPHKGPVMQHWHQGPVLAYTGAGWKPVVGCDLTQALTTPENSRLAIGPLLVKSDCPPPLLKIQVFHLFRCALKTIMHIVILRCVESLFFSQIKNGPNDASGKSNKYMWLVKMQSQGWKEFRNDKFYSCKFIRLSGETQVYYLLNIMPLQNTDSKKLQVSEKLTNIYWDHTYFLIIFLGLIMDLQLFTNHNAIILHSPWQWRNMQTFGHTGLIFYMQWQH